MLGERLTSGKPTQECRGGECRDTQAKIGTQNPALHGARPSTFKAQVGHSEEDTRNGTRHLEEQCRQGDPVNVGQTAIIDIAGNPEKGAGYPLVNPSQSDYPHQRSLRAGRTARQQQRRSAAADDGHRPQIVQRLNAGIEQKLGAEEEARHGYLTVTKMHRLTPMRTCATVASLMQMSWVPGANVPREKVPFSSWLNPAMWLST